jgi:aminoglycoside phosphotransferase (APT) family kinase protein
MNNSITQVIGSLRSQAQELWPEAPPEDFKIVRHFARPYSQVYRLQLVAPHSSASRFVYAKLHAPGAKLQARPEKYLARLETEFKAGRRLYETLRHEREIAVVKPVACYPDFLAIVSEEAPGESLANVIAREAKLWPAPGKLEQLAQYCQRAGQALAAMQKATAEVSRFAPAELLEYIDVRMRRLLESRQVPFSPADRRQIIKFLEAAIPAIPAEQLGLCGAHGDYAPFNLLACPEKITIVDFTMFRTGSVYNDLTYFYHRLEGYLHKPIYRAATIRRLQEEFLRGYMEKLDGSKSLKASSVALAGAREWHVADDLLFKILWLKHVVNNYSAIMRQRVVAKGKKLSLPVQLFNQHVFRRYNRWLSRFCQ